MAESVVQAIVSWLQRPPSAVCVAALAPLYVTLQSGGCFLLGKGHSVVENQQSVAA